MDVGMGSRDNTNPSSSDCGMRGTGNDNLSFKLLEGDSLFG